MRRKPFLRKEDLKPRGIAIFSVPFFQKKQLSTQTLIHNDDVKVDTLKAL
jgi:hypothetical protein